MPIPERVHESDDVVYRYCPDGQPLRTVLTDLAGNDPWSHCQPGLVGGRLISAEAAARAVPRED